MTKIIVQNCRLSCWFFLLRSGQLGVEVLFRSKEAYRSSTGHSLVRDKEIVNESFSLLLQRQND